MLLDPLPDRNQKEEGAYADILYPKAMLDIMCNVIRGIDQQLANPEKTMDSLLMKWLSTKTIDQATYIATLTEAIGRRGCLDGLIARLNVEVLLEPDQGDTITICSKRRFRLAGENAGAFAVGDDGVSIVPMDGLRPLPDQLNHWDGQAYEQHSTTVNRAPKEGLSDQAKDVVLKALKSSGCDFLTERSAAYHRLETVFRHSSPEQNILARLAFLIAFQRLQQCGPTQAITALLPNRLTKRK